MRKVGTALLAIGLIGLLLVTFRFAEAYQPMWIRAVKRLPDKPNYTHDEVQSAVLEHIDSTRSTLYLGVAFSAIQVVGTILVCRSRGQSHEHQTI